MTKYNNFLLKQNEFFLKQTHFRVKKFQFPLKGAEFFYKSFRFISLENRFILVKNHFRVIKNHFRAAKTEKSIIRFACNYAANTAARIGNVAESARNQMQVNVRNCLSGGFAFIEPDIKTFNFRINQTQFAFNLFR